MSKKKTQGIPGLWANVPSFLSLLAEMILIIIKRPKDKLFLQLTLLLKVVGYGWVTFQY